MPPTSRRRDSSSGFSYRGLSSGLPPSGEGRSEGQGEGAKAGSFEMPPSPKPRHDSETGRRCDGLRTAGLMGGSFPACGGVHP